jgi:hypothetical protein
MSNSSEEKIMEYLKSIDCDTWASHHLAIMLDMYLKKENFYDYKSASIIVTKDQDGLRRKKDTKLFVLEHRQSNSINVYFCPDKGIVLFETARGAYY